MAEKSDKQGWMPKHLRSLFEEQDEGLSELLPEEGKAVRTGRLGRALKMSKLAVGGGSRWLVNKAKNVASSEEVARLRDKAQSIALAKDMLQTFSEMRGISMKLGQMMSYMDDVLPPEARKVLTLLQRDAPPMPYAQIAAQITEGLGSPPEELFAHFSKTPLAAASIGQVHRATLHDGTEVAVKVQYPGIDEAMSADLKNGKVFSLFQRMFFFNTDTEAIMKELEERFLDECDYLKEAEYQETFYRRFEGHPWLIIPEVHREFCSKKVLTTTYQEGLGFYEWLAQDPSEEERRRNTHLLYRFYIGSLYLDGFFNCDPHPGNYIFRDDGKMVFLDFGCCRHFPDERRLLWKSLCNAVTHDDTERIHELGVEMGFVKAKTEYDREAYVELMRYLYRPYLKDEPFDFGMQRPETTFRTMFLDNPNLFKLNMPHDAVFLNRIGFGLVSILSEIGSALNCRRQIGLYFEGKDPDWPEDPHLKVMQSHEDP